MLMSTTCFADLRNHIIDWVHQVTVCLTKHKGKEAFCPNCDKI